MEVEGRLFLFLRFFLLLPQILTFLLLSLFSKQSKNPPPQPLHSRPQALRPQRGHHGRRLDAHPGGPGARQEARRQGKRERGILICFLIFAVDERKKKRNRRKKTHFFFLNPPPHLHLQSTTRTPTSPSTPTRSSPWEPRSRPGSSPERSATSSSSTSPLCRSDSRPSAA